MNTVVGLSAGEPISIDEVWGQIESRRHDAAGGREINHVYTYRSNSILMLEGRLIQR